MKNILLSLSFLMASQFNSIAQIPGGARPGGGYMNMGHFYGKVVDANKKGIDGITIQLKNNKFDPATKKTTEVVVGTMISAANGDFSFDNLPIMGASFKLIFTGIGYKKLEKPVSFNIKMNGGQNMQDMLAMVLSLIHI